MVAGVRPSFTSLKQKLARSEATADVAARDQPHASAVGCPLHQGEGRLGQPVERVQQTRQRGGVG